MALRLPVVLSHQASYCGRGTSRTAGDCKTFWRSEEHTSLQSQSNLVCRLLLEKKKTKLEGERHRAPARHGTGGGEILILAHRDQESSDVASHSTPRFPQAVGSRSEER